ncbi:MAG: hypothetical protein WBB78_12605, partial [Propionicimonas sp.]
ALRAADVALVLDCSDARLPAVVHWGAALPGLGSAGVEDAVTPELAIYSLCLTETTDTPTLGRVVLPGLDPDALYEVSPVEPAAIPVAAGLDPGIPGLGSPPRLQRGWPLRLSGRALGTVGVRTPWLPPDRCLLLEVTRLARPETPAIHPTTHTRTPEN